MERFGKRFDEPTPGSGIVYRQPRLAPAYRDIRFIGAPCARTDQNFYRRVPCQLTVEKCPFTAICMPGRLV